MDAAHAGLPVVDWVKPARSSRPAARLYLPGTDCTSGRTSTRRGQSATLPTAATVPGGAVDYRSPFPSVPTGVLVYDCRKGPPRTTVPTTTTSAPGASTPGDPDGGGTSPPASRGNDRGGGNNGGNNGNRGGGNNDDNG
jgi:hypothetical protein